MCNFYDSLGFATSRRSGVISVPPEMIDRVLLAYGRPLSTHSTGRPNALASSSTHCLASSVEEQICVAGGRLPRESATPGTATNAASTASSCTSIHARSLPSVGIQSSFAPSMSMFHILPRVAGFVSAPKKAIPAFWCSPGLRTPGAESHPANRQSAWPPVASEPRPAPCS